jgi:hypothetical protein
MKLPHTANALRLFELESQVLDQKLRDIATNAQMDKWQTSEAAAANRVREAFYRDCQEQNIPNSREHCMLVDIYTLKRWIEEG